MARECEPIWREFGANDYVECVGDDVPYGERDILSPRGAGQG